MIARKHPSMFQISRICLVSVLCLAGCGEGEVDYFPLDSNRYWQYRIERTTMDGAVTQKYLLKALPAQILYETDVVAKRTVDGHQYFYRRDELGIHRIAHKLRDQPEIEADMPAVLILPHELQVGFSWEQRSVTSVLENSGPPWETLFRLIHPITLTYTIESLDDVVAVKAGEFRHCLRVVANGKATAEVGNYVGRADIRVHTIDWYAPNVGLVRSERHETSSAKPLGAGSVSLELESF
ncbi:MAG: hypothetical protein ACI915_001162 [Gammaproteobacteria bacterium]|jgi:hypothetical protein